MAGSLQENREPRQVPKSTHLKDTQERAEKLHQSFQPPGKQKAAASKAQSEGAWSFETVKKNLDLDTFRRAE